MVSFAQTEHVLSATGVLASAGVVRAARRIAATATERETAANEILMFTLAEGQAREADNVFLNYPPPAAVNRNPWIATIGIGRCRPQPHATAPPAERERTPDRLRLRQQHLGRRARRW